MTTTSYLKAQLRKQAVLRIEKFATDQGDVGVFATITAPSRYHPVAGKSDGINQTHVAFGKPTPADAQRYLRNVWGRIRSRLHREGISIRGVRFTEQHQDRCPQWHMLMFVAPENQARYEAVVAASAIIGGSNDDQGKFKLLHMEAGKSTAAGYIAKYIAKDINGDNVNFHYAPTYIRTGIAAN
ncbi:replication endonuclease [Collimonas sp. PA-H2]|uniref:replication endonuclease n=1 Tax=Collimonas sp. PA-H2 TaxID=1881062 RepID=UPI000BF5F7D8|nr:replication endonuclease [Collimonas sp. PA-H2]